MAAPERIGEYEILGELGRGGYGVVWRARKASLPEREVALKEVPLEAGNPEAIARTMREVRALTRIDSLHIVRLHDAFESRERGTLCIVMERLGRATLRHRIARAASPLPLDFVIETVAGVLDALEATHGARDPEGRPQPIVHRDLKPENIGFAPWRDSEIVKVMDFGIARIQSADGDRIAKSLGTLHACTPAYAAPEVLLGAVATPPADLWSLGVVLWEMLAGHHPFVDVHGVLLSPMQALVSNQGVLPPLPAQIAAALPPAIAALQRELCAHDAALRPTAREASEKLRTAGSVAAAPSAPAPWVAPQSAPLPPPTAASARFTQPERPAPPTAASARFTQPERPAPPTPPTSAGFTQPERQAPPTAAPPRGRLLAGIVLVLALLTVGAIAVAISGATRAPGTLLSTAALPTSTCPALSAFPPELAALPAPAIERRLRDLNVLIPSALDQHLREVRAALSSPPEGLQDCRYRVALLYELRGHEQMAPRTTGGWAIGRTSQDLAALFRTVPLRRPWTAVERDQVLGWLERNMIANLRQRSPDDGEYWRHMYYALLIQCEATPESRRALGAPDPDEQCMNVEPGMP